MRSTSGCTIALSCSSSCGSLNTMRRSAARSISPSAARIEVPHRSTIDAYAGVPCLHGATRQHVGVDDRGAALAEELRDGRFAAADVAREPDEKHAPKVGSASVGGKTNMRLHGGPKHA